MWRCEGGDLIVSHTNDHGPSHRRLQNVAAVEASKTPLWRNFLYGSIFDFCNNIGTYRTSEFRRMFAVRRERTTFAHRRLWNFRLPPNEHRISIPRAGSSNLS